MVVLEEIGVCIAHRQNMVAQYIATRTITELCFAADRKPGMRLSRRWWKKPDLDIMGIRAGQADMEGGRRQGGEEKSESEGDGE